MILGYSGTQSWKATATAAAIISATVFVACLIGILTRPLGFLAALWPANAIFLALLVRNPAYATPWSWGGAFIAYMAADLLTGGNLSVTFGLTIANMVGVLTGYLGFQFIACDDRRLHRPLSVLYLFAICAAAAAMSALAGGWISVLLFHTDFITGVEFWFTTELVNSLIILPPILTFPHHMRNWRSSWPPFDGTLLRRAAPAMALLASAGISTLSGGPGALAFPIPALLWCAISYSLFTTATLTMALSCWLLIVVAAGLIVDNDTVLTLHSTTSIRLGIALMALGPLTVASVNTARNQLLASLSHAVNQDVLTGALSRRAFMERGHALIAAATGRRNVIAMLMFDVDNFKAINDLHGHQTGDQVLVEFVRALEITLDDFGHIARIGGEEFAVLITDLKPDMAAALAERCRLSIEQTHFVNADGEPLSVSTSVGLAYLPETHDGDANAGLRSLLGLADGALYCAKRAGRNRVVAAAA
ncbi:MAG TPA: diguanylate cyclase [Devosia sp.]|nr:diguanylate cyclase [Devosia sp.]